MRPGNEGHSLLQQSTLMTMDENVMSVRRPGKEAAPPTTVRRALGNITNQRDQRLGGSALAHKTPGGNVRSLAGAFQEGTLSMEVTHGLLAHGSSTTSLPRETSSEPAKTFLSLRQASLPRPPTFSPPSVPKPSSSPPRAPSSGPAAPSPSSSRTRRRAHWGRSKPAWPSSPPRCAPRPSS